MTQTTDSHISEQVVDAYCLAWFRSYNQANPFDADVKLTEELKAHIKAGLQAAFKVQQGEPVGETYLCDCCLTPFDGGYECPSCGYNGATKKPVYTQPQPKQEPVGEGLVVVHRAILKTLGIADPVIDTIARPAPQPRTWVGLTPEMRDEICLGDESIARAVEAKLKELNT
jgi:hypothetical protein